MEFKDPDAKHGVVGGLGQVGDPLDPLSAIDPLFVRSQLDYVIGMGTHDPLRSISSAVDTGSAIANFLSSASSITGSLASARTNLDNSILALGELSRPYNQLVNVPAFDPYLSSMTSLASASSMASTVKGLSHLGSSDILSSVTKSADLGLSATGPAIPSTINPSASFDFGLAARGTANPSTGILSATSDFGFLATGPVIHSPVISSLSTSTLTQALAPTMLASTRAVLGIDSAYAGLGATDFASGVLSNPPLFRVPSYITNLHEGLSTLTTAAKATWDIVALRPDVLSTTTLYSVCSPGVEIYTASQAAAAISLPVNKVPAVDSDIEEIIDTTVDGLGERLLSLSPSLREMYRGAILAIERGGPDWRRQSMVSFRELTTHVMHILAPDERVKPWAKPEHFDKGRLTRRARLEFIFEPVAAGEFTNFFTADLKVSIELFNVLNDGTHRLTSTATPQQLRYLRGRVANLVSAMLEARGH